MFEGAPLIVFAQVLRALSFLLAIASPTRAPSFVSPTFVFLVAFAIELLGFFDLSQRTHGTARALTRLMWRLPLLAIAAVLVDGIVENTVSPSIASVARWLYAGEILLGVIALWTTARRGASLAIGAFVLSFAVYVLPVFKLGLIDAFVRATGVVGKGLLSVGPLVLSAVLAIFAGRAADPVPFDLVKARRSLLRAPVPIVAIAAIPIAVLSGHDPRNASSIVAILGCLLLVIPAFRIRARSRLAYAAIVLAIYAACSVPSVAAASSMYDYVATGFDVAILAALGVLLFAVARTRYAIAVVAIAVLAIALHGRVIGVMCELAAELGAAFALVGAGGALRDAPTVADVFA